jgi:hypothetical protein
MPRMSTRAHRGVPWTIQVRDVQRRHFLWEQRIQLVRVVQCRRLLLPERIKRMLRMQRRYLLWEQRIKRVWFM